MEEHARTGARTVAVIGAGWLGSEVARVAATRGWRALAATRSGRLRGTTPAPHGVEPVRLDVLREGDGALGERLHGVDVVVLCLAPGRDQDRRRLYVEGTATVARASRRAAVRRLILASSTSALADRDGWADEDAVEWPDSPRGRIQREAEARLREELDGSDVAWTILRLAGLYGPDRELARIYRVGDPSVRAGDGLEHTNLVHRDDAVAAILAAMDLPASQSGIIHVCDDDHRTRRQVAEAAARAAGAPPPRWAEPDDGRPPRGKKVGNRRMKEVLGVKLRHPDHVLA